MRYIKFTKVDAETGKSANLKKAKNGEVFPSIPSLKILFQDQNITEFWYGTVANNAKDDPDNQIKIITDEEFAQAVHNNVEKIKQNILKELDINDKAIRTEHLNVYHNTALIAGMYKVDQAKLLLAGLGDPNDTLHNEANIRGITPESLANKVLDKYNKYIYLDSLIAGIRGKLQDRIESFTVNLLDPLASWNEFISYEDIGNGTLLQKYNSDIYGRMIPLLNQGV